MEWVETTGRTLEEARDAALDMLGVDESDAEFVTLTEPRPGSFGRLRGEARVRARVLPTTPPPKRGRTRRPAQRREQSPESRKSQQRGEIQSEAGARSETRSPEPEEAKSAGSASAGGGKSRSSRRRRSRSETGPGAGTSVALVESAGDETSGGAASNGSGSVEAGAGTASRSRPQRKRPPRESQKEEDTVTETLSLEEQGELAKRFIEGLINELGMQATVTARPSEDEEAVQVAVDGDELGILVGQGGATLSAIQELARTVVQRKAGGHIERIFVDIAGYRARRAEALARFTKKVVDDVISSGTEKALEAMSPADRKVVHDTVNEIGGAVTRSEGVEPRRYVVISPAATGASESEG